MPSLALTNMLRINKHVLHLKGYFYEWRSQFPALDIHSVES